MKKKLLIIMSLLIIFTMSFGFSASKADELNALEILKGDGTDYLLEERLTRAQALTFVIRLIGKESFVKEKEELLSNTGFTDVPKGEWYTPYVGYGRGFGLVQGYGDGTFKPNAYLSEREFYAMVLNALDIEYTWGTVEEIAFENNIIDSKDEFNETDYLRSSVVDVLYKTLDQNKEIIDTLVDSGIVSQADVAGLKLYKTDELKTEIKSVISNSKTETVVKLNESIEEINLSIEDLTIEDYTIEEDTITIEHEESNSGESYTLTISSVIDANGFEVKDLTKTFTAFKDEPIESNYFMISDVEAVSKSQINVYFTHEVTIGAALPLFYDIYRDDDLYVEGDFSSIAVAKMGTVDNGVSIWLKDDFLSGSTQYTLKVDSDLSSKLGVDIGDDAEYLFAGSSDENESLGIESFRVLNDKYIRIIYSHDVSNSATNKSNYSLENKTKGITYSSAFEARFTGTDELKYRQIDVKFLNIDPDEEFELTIEDIEDKFGERTIKENVIPFSKFVAEDDLDIDAVVAKDQGTVLLYFNQPLASNNTFNNILISNPSVSIDSKYFDSSNPYLLTLILADNDQLSSNEEYDLKILSGAVKDINEVANSEELTATFNGTSNPYPDIRMTDAYFVSDEHVYVRFNVPVSTSNSKSKFRLKYKDNDGDDQYENANGISFLNAYEAVIKFSDLSSSESYKIVADNVDDYSNQYQSEAIDRSVGRE